MTKKDQEYKEIFLAEALENFEDINRELTELEKKPDDESTINTIFRITHTLKGNATGMGYSEIAELAHVLEDLFGEIKSKQITLSREIFTALFKGVDVIGLLINSLKTGDKVAYRGIKTKLQVIINRSKEDQLPASAKTSKKTSNKKGEKTASKKGDTTNPVKKPNEKSDDEEKLEEINQIIGEKEEVLDESQNVIDPETMENENKITFSDLVQVPVRKLDNLLNLVGELIIERDRIIATNTSNNSNEYARLNRISSDLQYSVMDVRLVQVGFLFNKFHRVVRDAATVEDKKARLVLKGVDTEIDRNILQIISDSLIHLIRNAVSHGIEDPKTRKEQNKNEEGEVQLRARNDSDGVIIEIKDDGKGIDIQKIKEKAIKSGVYTSDMLQLMNRDEILMMVFEAGFSTREEVSSLSGRGVGMDVVKKAIDSIGGNIKIETNKGKGTTIVLKLPSSMAVKGTLLFEIEEETFAIPLSYTEAVVSLYKSDLHKVSNGLVSTYLGKTISIIFLKDLFNLKKEDNIRSNKILQKSFDDLHPETQLHVVIVTYNGRTIGLVVDKLLQQKEIVEKPLQRPLDQIKFLSGVTILGNGNVCPVLNIASITNYIFNMSLSNHKAF